MRRIRSAAALFTALLLIFTVLRAGFTAEGEADAGYDFPVTVALYVSDVPAGAVMLDLLVPAKEAETVAFNEENGRALGVSADSEIARLDADGYVSLTFRTAAPVEENELKYDITVCVSAETVAADPARFVLLEGVGYEEEDGIRYYDLRVTPGQPEEQAALAFAGAMEEDATVFDRIYTRFPGAPLRSVGSVRAAYLSADGAVLGISEPCAAEGSWFELDGTALSPSLYAERLSVNAVQLLIVAIAVLIVAAIWIVVILLQIRKRKKLRRRYLPAYFPAKGAPTDPALKKTLQRVSLGRALFLLLLLPPIVCCMFLYAERLTDEPVSVLHAALSVLLLIAALILNVALHEAGHALAGARAGFETTALQVGPFFFTRREGRLRREKRRLPPGAAGFTALTPRETDPALARPGLMFSAGGAANALLALGWGIAALTLRDRPICPVLLLNACMSLFIALGNLVPAFGSGALTDGVQMKYAGKSPEAKAALLDGMRISAALYGGARIEELPEAWFRFDEAAAAEPCAAGTAADGALRLIAEGKPEDALSLGLRLLADDSALALSSKAALLPKVLWCMAVCGWDRERIGAFLCRELRALLDLRRPAPDQLPAKYAFELLVLRDGAAAGKTKALYDQLAARSYPWQAALDRFMIDEAKKRYEGGISE